MAYDKLFETLSKNKLINQAAVDKALFQDMTLSQLITLADNLCASIEAESSRPQSLSLTDYHFLASSNMTASHGSGCDTCQCRLTRVDRLSRFAALYSDTVYIQNYFACHRHLNPKNTSEEYHLRNSVHGDITIINAIEPLIRNGVVRFIPSAVQLCPNCDAHLIEQLHTFDANLRQHVKELDRLYSQATSADLRTLPTPSPHGYKYEIDVNCDEDLFEHGYIVQTSRLPPRLLRKVLNKPSLKLCHLSPSDILRSHLITPLLQAIATDLTYLRFYCSNSNLKYLTGRSIDISILQAITREDNFRKYNEVLSNQFMLEMPVFSNISLHSLLKVRADHRDAFTCYRDTINELINEYIAQGRELSPKMAGQIYSDIIQPKLLALDRRVSSIRRSALLRSLRDVAISAGSLTFGLYANYIPPEIRAGLVSYGIFQAVTTTKSLPDIVNTPPNIRNDNLYFLWKLSKMSKVI